MKVALLMSLLSFPGLVTSGPAVAVESAPSLFPPAAAQGLQSRGTTFRSHSEETSTAGEAAKQRASEQPIFTTLSLERDCMKMWCFLNRDSANKWQSRKDQILEKNQLNRIDWLNQLTGKPSSGIR